MIESIIDGYKHNSLRDPDYISEHDGVGRMLGVSIYSFFGDFKEGWNSLPTIREMLSEYFQPISIPYEMARRSNRLPPFAKEVLCEYFEPLAWPHKKLSGK